MSGKSSTQSPRVRSSGEKLYQACLDSVITGIENFPVDKRQRSSVTTDVNNVSITTLPSDAPRHSLTKRATTPPVQPQPIIAPLSPPPTPAHADQSSSPHSPTPRAAMNRAPLHGAPPHGRGSATPPRGPRGPRGPMTSYSPQDARGGRGAASSYGPQGARPSQNSPSPYGSQDARGSSGVLGNQQAGGNFAVQPVPNTGSMKLKKMAVKLVSATPPSGTATPLAAPTPAPESVKATPKVAESDESVKAPVDNPPLPSPSPATTKAKLGKPSASQESVLEDLFARLNAEMTSIADDVVKKEPSDELSAVQSASEDISNKGRISPVSKPGVNLVNSRTTAPDSREHQPDVTVITPEETKDMSKTEMEQLYLRKAYDYLQALPAGNSVSVQILKTVSKKLRSSHAPSTSLSEVEAEKLQARFAFAIVDYVKKSDKSVKSITTDTAKYILREAEGNMLQIFSKLVDLEYLSLADIDSSAGLCKTLLDVLPRAETATAPLVIEINPAVTTTTSAPVIGAKSSVTTTADLLDHASKDPVDMLRAWPAQDKRENPAQHRTCILKGVSGVKSINELQALVWGGRLESIQMPAPGSNFAIVRFLTPEACDKYFNATENGIELGGINKNVIFVEKQPGPTSINDKIRNCTEGDASRCVRALDAEEDWSEMMLTTLARGKGKIKRVIDCIQQGKTARGRHYIEFRFASIYDALGFRRELMEDTEWEPCTISYATDPCETAQGVHYTDPPE